MIAGFFAVFASMLGSSGWIRLPGPGIPSFGEVDVDVKLPAAARIVKVEPISLDCRARVYAEVPIVGEREHSLGQWVYRIDRITMTAYGDVDTCVRGDATTINYRSDGTTEVIIPGSAIEFVRPRVDTVKTAESVNVDKDFVGKLTDVFPWVSDNNDLTPNAYAYAQNVIGSSECMREAFQVTEGILLDAYEQQVVDQGADPDKVTVRIEGEPEYPDPLEVDPNGVTFETGTDIVCEASGELN